VQGYLFDSAPDFSVKGYNYDNGIFTCLDANFAGYQGFAHSDPSSLY
jgi:hypothetical protein